MNRHPRFPRHRQVAVGALMLSALVSLVQANNWQALPDQAPGADSDTPAQIELGRMLYFDPRMSSTGTVSCNSCHNLMEGGDDSRPTSFGVKGQLGSRNAPTVWNAAFLSVQFWDGRAKTLQEQAKGPPANPIEMGMDSVDAAAERIREIPGYLPYFKAAYGPQAKVDADSISAAIASFERTLITPASPYDRYVKGDHNALSTQQQRGMEKFASTGCTSCHSGPNFSGPALPTGLGFFQRFPAFPGSPYSKKYDLTADRGRAETTGDEAFAHVWRVPGLRNLSYTAPYFHNGRVASLDEAVRVMASTQLDKDLSVDDTADIVAFLQALDGPFPKLEMPRLPPARGDLLE